MIDNFVKALERFIKEIDDGKLICIEEMQNILMTHNNRVTLQSNSYVFAYNETGHYNESYVIVRSRNLDPNDVAHFNNLEVDYNLTDNTVDYLYTKIRELTMAADLNPGNLIQPLPKIMATRRNYAEFLPPISQISIKDIKEYDTN